MTAFKEGDRVRLVFDIKNDGTLFGKRRGLVLQKAGNTGYISRKSILNDDTIYEVHFLESNKIIGCKEKELIPADLDWTPPEFKKGDQVKANVNLVYQGKQLSAKGSTGRITAIRFLPNLGYIYETLFEDANGLYCLAIENQLTDTTR